MTIHRDRAQTASYGLRLRRLASLEDIPLDILYLVADHSPIQGLVALSTVSKRLRNLLNDRGIWNKLYKKNISVLPPGPYDWQSTSYLINVLLRSERLHFVWTSLSTSPKTFPTRCVRFSHNAAFSVLLGRWLLVAEGSTLICYDSHHSNISESAVVLHDPDVRGRIFRLFSVGTIQEDGVLAVVVLLFKDSFTIAKVIMDREKPSGLRSVFTSVPPVVTGWIDLVDVRLYNRVLVMNIGECSSDWESSGRLVIMDIGTLRRYHIPASADGVFDPIHTTTFFSATQTHVIKVIECHDGSSVQSKVEYFPLPRIGETHGSNDLYPSHHYQVGYSIRIRESPTNGGKISFTLCESGNSLPNGAALKAMDACLEPDGSISSAELPLIGYPIRICCVGRAGEHGRGVAATGRGQILPLTLWHHGWSAPGSFADCTHVRKPGTSELLAVDTFGGIVFFSRRWSDHMAVEVVDFGRDVQNEGHGCTASPNRCARGGVGL